jgi:creatinine amidohydrolase
MDRFSTWEDITESRLAFLPVGSMEQHGPHLPIGTDGIIAEEIARRLALAHQPSLLLPLIPFSCSFEHAGFPGSISLKVATIAALIKDIVESLSVSGISKLVIVNGHGGNHVLWTLVQELNHPEPRILLVPSIYNWARAYERAGLSSTPSQDMHAGEGETSIIMHLHPGVVRQDKIADIDCKERPLLETLGMKAYTETGVIGFPSHASAEKGEILLNTLVNEISNTVRQFVGSEV